MRPSMLGLACDGLRRKMGRNLLTMSGVFIGVLSLTLIVALGEGMARFVQRRVQGAENLRQIGLSPGFGFRIRESADVRIDGTMSERRRKRMRRSALARRRPGTFIGRRAQALDESALARVAALPGVASITPIVLERYRVRFGEKRTDATSTLGIDVARRRYADRVLVGRYFSAEDADEVLLHEYLAYQWGYRSEADLARLVGKTITLEVIQNRRMPGLPPGLDLRALLSRVDMSVLTDEERAALPKIATKLMQSFVGSGASANAGEPITRTFRIAGVLREMESGDPFNVIEDGNALQVDIFLPQATAIALYESAPINRELGFQRALVLTDRADQAERVEGLLRDEGYTAFSVASVIGRIEEAFAGITIVVAFLTGIALVVAALGIVNTMVTSVLERTREIGLWKAVGATSTQVRSVFLLEAALIGLVGGLLGLGTALLLMVPAEGIAADAIAQRSPIPLDGSVFHVPSWLFLAGPGLAVVVAMLAALYPAHRATRVDPVRALRHD